jgi:hypothetical protein
MTAAVIDDDEVGLALRGRILNLTHNWDQSRQYHASLSQRVEGFTEVWGDPTSQPVVGGRTQDASTSPGSGSSKSNDWTVDEGRSLEHILELPYPQRSITLFQYRPAWEEQLALRVLKMKFVVVNCPFAVWEATGPLPCLRDLRSPGIEHDAGAAASTVHPPVLVGRRQQHLPASSDSSPPSNSILHYLQESYINGDGNSAKNDGAELRDWDRGFLNPSQKNQAQVFVELVRGTIEPCLAVLGLDWMAHEQVYRHQALRASCGGSLESPWWVRWHGWWQVWSERVHVTRQLSASQRSMTVQQALERPRAAFRMLEGHLLSVHSNGTGFIMGTDEAVLIDIVLWPCLARSLSNLHMVVVLAEFPALCRYAQHVWDSFFALKSSREDWEVWNAHENSRNAFGDLPMMTPSRPTSKFPRDFTHALDLMKHLSLQRHDLHEQLLLTQQEAKKCASPHLTAPPFQTFHRWRFGDSYRPRSKHGGVASGPASTSTHDRQEEKALREYQKRDEFWIVTVFAASVSAVLLFGYAS